MSDSSRRPPATALCGESFPSRSRACAAIRGSATWPWSLRLSCGAVWSTRTGRRWLAPRSTLSGFPAGAGVLTVRAGGYERLERSLAEVPPNPLELVLSPEPEIDVALSLGEITIDVTPVTVRGRVTGPDGMPVPAASIHAWRGAGLRFFYGGRGEHRTGPEGDFEFQIEPVVYTLMARRDNAQGPEVEVSAVAGDEPYVELTVPEPRLLRVRVLGLNPAEIAEVGVSVQASFAQGVTMGIGMRRPAGGTEAEPR